MSIQTQIDRISGNVSAALSAIAEKGVTVPDGSNSDALHELILSIEAGGGLPTGLSKVAHGTVTPNFGTSSVIITHGLGVTPNFAILFATSATSSGSSHTIATEVLYKSSSSVTYEYASGYNSSSALSVGGIYTTVSTSSVLTDTTCTFSRSSYHAGTASQGALFSRNPYRWIAGVYA